MTTTAGPTLIGSVYFLQGRETKRIKIGYSGNMLPYQRLAELSTGASEYTDLLGFIPGTRRLEGAIHRLFRTDRFKGEWFTSSPRLVAFIRKILAYSSVHFGISRRAVDLAITADSFNRWRLLSA